MSTVARSAAALGCGALVLGTAIWLMKTGVYGLTLFVVMPVLCGAVVGWIQQRRSYKQAALAGAVATACLTCLLILLGMEGVFCIAMVLPLGTLLGAAGGMLGYALRERDPGPGRVLALVLFPAATAAFDVTAEAPVFEVRTAVEIAAPAERVWEHVVAFPELQPPREWYFRSGIAYPIRARIEGSGVGAIRYCEFSTGAFVEPIEVWEVGRLLRFRVTENPAPMTELSPYAGLVPGHLHGYFESTRGQFRLTALAGGRTLLEGTTWYRHGLWPAQYWRWWSDAIVHRIHLRVLHHIQALAESAVSTS